LCTKKSGSRAIAPGRGGWEGFDVRRAFRKSAMTTPLSSARIPGRGAVFAASGRGPQPDRPRRIPRARDGRHRTARGASPELSARRLIPEPGTGDIVQLGARAPSCQRAASSPEPGTGNIVQLGARAPSCQRAASSPEPGTGDIVELGARAPSFRGVRPRPATRSPPRAILEPGTATP
jgi:hypothetical protein